METIYQGLGLSLADVELLRSYKLLYLLDKIKEQQEELEDQKGRLQQALQKIEKDLAAARDAQMSLLPQKLVGVPEVEFCARFHPSMFVSGDIYNIFRLDENHVGLYHIDISGHGVPSALFSVSLSNMLNSNISSRNLLKVPAKEPPYYRINPPNVVIAMLDEEYSYERFNIFFTMIYMVINIRERFIRLTRAGHNPPIIMRADGRVDIPEDGGIPIGWGLPRDDNVLELKIEPGDRIYLFSDGINEAASPDNELFSINRLIDTLLQNKERTLEENLDEVISAVRRHTQKDAFEDDVSIIGMALNS